MTNQFLMLRANFIAQTSKRCNHENDHSMAGWCSVNDITDAAGAQYIIYAMIHFVLIIEM